MKFYISLILTMLLTGCGAQSLYIVPRPFTENTDVVYDDGMPVGVSVLDSTYAMFTGDILEKEIRVVVYIENNSQHVIEIYPDSMAVAGVIGDEFHFLHTLTPDEYMERIRKRDKRQSLGYALSRGMQNFGAGRNSTYVYGVGTVTETDETERRLAYQESSRDISAHRSEQAKHRAQVNEGLLFRHTLYPGEYTTGIVAFEYEEYPEYVIVIQAEDDFHVMLFEAMPFR